MYLFFIKILKYFTETLLYYNVFYNNIFLAFYPHMAGIKSSTVCSLFYVTFYISRKLQVSIVTYFILMTWNLC
jgi:hypothetical protein